MPDDKITLKEAHRRFKEPLPKLTAIKCSVIAYALRAFIVVANYGLSLKEKIVTPANAPTLTKTYACRPKLSLRIFSPKTFDEATDEKLPTVFTIHGGGFVMGDPRDDDHFNYTFANMHSVLVVALDYSKSPRVHFPTPTYDLEALILAALSDSSLPIDQDRVAIMGSSAGGNLALSVSLLPSMSGSGDGVRRIKTAVPMYPVVDMSVRREYKIHTRQWKPSFGGFRAKTTDMLFPLSPVFEAAYTLPGQDHHDPLLNPFYAEKEQLPPNIFFLACELDMLAGEAWRMICGLTGREIGDETVGREAIGPKGELILDDERYSFETKTKEGSYRWLLIPDQIHAYDKYENLILLHGDKQLSKDAELKLVEAQKLIGKWLFEGPFA
ncbi:hypothetical protein LB503_010585 [Fusarium chuoi]|nr:hypothetical protein LB503_010585 [Fusarium chuoi]